MNKTKYVLWILMWVSGSAFAHTGLKESVPAEGSVLNAAPENLQLAFTEEVRLLRLDVIKVSESEAQTLDIGFMPDSVAKTEYSFSLPELSQGHYRVDWSVMGPDSHTVRGSVTFGIGSKVDIHEQAQNHESHDVHHDSHSGH